MSPVQTIGPIVQLLERRMDQLSDVFRSMRIQGAAYKRLEATAPWGGSLLGRYRSAGTLRVSGSRIGASDLQESAPNHSPSPAVMFSFSYSMMSLLH